MEIIKIKNWDKYYPRKDVKSSSWFRMQIDFFIDPKFFNESIETKLVWIYLLSESGRAYKDEIQFNVALCSSILRVDTYDILTSLESLESLGVVTRPNPTESDRIVTLRNETERNVTNKISKDISPTKRKRSAVLPSEFDLTMATRWINWAASTGKITAEEINHKNAANTFRLMRTVNNIQEGQIEEIFQFVKGDDFWAKQALSPVKLRKKSDNNGLMKFRNILTAMERGCGEKNRRKKESTNDVIQRARERLIQDGYGSR